MPTFASIDCRLDALIATVNALGDIGQLKVTLLKKLNRAKAQAEGAEPLVSQHRRRPALVSLKHAIQSMTAFKSRIAPGVSTFVSSGGLQDTRMNPGQRNIPPAIRAALVASAKSILHDLRLLRRTLASAR